MNIETTRSNAVFNPQETSTGLIDILLSSLEALAAAGQADAACRLAGRACAALRNKDPSGWRRFNALLHRLCKSTA